MKTKEKDFDTVTFFRAVKEKIARNTEGMTLRERREWMRQVREGKIKVT